MDKQREKIDLHTHTIFSDGWKSPTALIDAAKKENLSIISITDHDSVDAYKYLEIFKSKIKQRIILIPGIEFTSCVNNQDDVHILGYGIDYKDAGIKDIQTSVREKQLVRKNIFNNILYDFSLAHIADILDKRDTTPYGLKNYNFYDLLKIFKVDGVVIDQVKEKYKEAIRFLEAIDGDAAQIIDIIHNSGGYAFFAHPGHYKWSNGEMLSAVLKLKECGIDGIEVFHPRNNYEHQIILSALCDTFSLMKSAGSDYHGSKFHRVEQKLGGEDKTTNQPVSFLPVIKKVIDEGKGIEL